MGARVSITKDFMNETKATLMRIHADMKEITTSMESLSKGQKRLEATLMNIQADMNEITTSMESLIEGQERLEENVAPLLSRTVARKRNTSQGVL
jgi:chromosome segregation ATPase